MFEQRFFRAYFATLIRFTLSAKIIRMLIPAESRSNIVPSFPVRVSRSALVLTALIALAACDRDSVKEEPKPYEPYVYEPAPVLVFPKVPKEVVKPQPASGSMLTSDNSIDEQKLKQWVASRLIGSTLTPIEQWAIRWNWRDSEGLTKALSHADHGHDKLNEIWPQVLFVVGSKQRHDDSALVQFGETKKLDLGSGFKNLEVLSFKPNVSVPCFDHSPDVKWPYGCEANKWKDKVLYYLFDREMGENYLVFDQTVLEQAAQASKLTPQNFAHMVASLHNLDRVLGNAIYDYYEKAGEIPEEPDGFLHSINCLSANFVATSLVRDYVLTGHLTMQQAIEIAPYDVADELKDLPPGKGALDVLKMSAKKWKHLLESEKQSELNILIDELWPKPKKA